MTLGSLALVSHVNPYRQKGLKEYRAERIAARSRPAKRSAQLPVYYAGHNIRGAEASPEASIGAASFESRSDRNPLKVGSV